MVKANFKEHKLCLNKKCYKVVENLDDGYLYWGNMPRGEVRKLIKELKRIGLIKDKK